MPRVIHVFRQPDRFVAGTVGQPGERSFYLQATEQARKVSVLLEKQQVSVLADRISALLQEVARRFGSELPDEEPGTDLDPLAVPLEEEFRVGTMGLGWDAESRAVVIELLAVTEGEVDESVVLDEYRHIVHNPAVLERLVAVADDFFDGGGRYPVGIGHG